jgi:heat shock protein HtpX
MPTTFRDLIAANRRNSALLVVLFCLFVAVVALVLGLGLMAVADPDAVANLDWGLAAFFGGGAAAFALIYSVFAYYAGSRMVLAVSGARPLRKADDRELYNVVEEMAIAAGVPMPQIYLIEDSAPNAFATAATRSTASWPSRAGCATS